MAYKDKSKDRAWRLANKDKTRKNEFKCNYKATDEQWEMYENATNCSICGVEFGDGHNKKCQDHDHNTGKLREVICNRCNLLEGLAINPELLLLIYTYKEKYK
jgi:hypothetical protein